MTKLRYILLGIFLLADTGYSFYQHYHMPLYGDMADIIMPTPVRGYYQVLHDPFGLNVLLKNEIYPNPNRFFAHWSVSAYFLNVPLLLQKFVDPIDSIYLSCAIAKIIIQILIIYLLAVYISNTANIFRLDFLMAAALITPLFQAAGFGRYMGIIDQSVIYTFFYALPLGLLLLLFLPFYKAIYYDKNLKFNLVIIILLSLFTVALSLNGPLVPGVVLILCPLALISMWMKNYRQLAGIKPSFKRVFMAFNNMPNLVIFFFIGFCIVSLYSLYIGRNNELNYGDHISLTERYAKLPTGIYNLISKKIAFPLLLLMIAINATIISKRYKSPEGQRILNLIKWFSVFTICYILLLPLGGFRNYRENIIRYDTIMPVTFGLIFVFGITSFFLIRNISKKYKTIYILSIIILLSIFTNADRLNTQPYKCERGALETLARATENIVLLNCNCPVMDWRIITDYKLSDLNAQLFNYWNITKGEKLYYYSN